TGITLNEDGSQIAWSPDCARGTVDYQQGALDEVRPDTVMWLSTWELADYQTAEGERVRFGTAAFDKWLLGEMERVRAMVAADGARLVMVTNPPIAPNPIRELNQGDLDRDLHVNALMRKFAAQHPDDVVLLDL